MGKLITSLVFFVVLLSIACSQPIEWDEIRSKDVAWVSSEWGKPELVISSEFAVGEPSITADGKYLYFEQIFTDGKGNYNPEIMVVKK